MNGNYPFGYSLLRKPTTPVWSRFRAHSWSVEIFIEMQETTYSRKLDTSGRLTIPTRLREEVGLVIGAEYHFFLHEEGGRKYICIDCGPTITPEMLDKAMKIVQESGMKVVQNDD